MFLMLINLVDLDNLVGAKVEMEENHSQYVRPSPWSSLGPGFRKQAEVPFTCRAAGDDYGRTLCVTSAVATDVPEPAIINTSLQCCWELILVNLIQYSELHTYNELLFVWEAKQKFLLSAAFCSFRTFVNFVLPAANNTAVVFTVISNSFVMRREGRSGQ